MYDNRYIFPKYCAKEQNVQEVLVFWNVQLYIYLVTTVTNYFADSDYSVLIGYYSWRVTNQIVLWAGHWVRPRSADDRQEKCAASESRMHFWLNLLYRLLDKKKKKQISDNKILALTIGLSLLSGLKPVCLSFWLHFCIQDVNSTNSRPFWSHFCSIGDLGNPRLALLLSFKSSL